MAPTMAKEKPRRCSLRQLSYPTREDLLSKQSHVDAFGMRMFRAQKDDASQ
jgi:hypothetical protein